MRPRAHPRDPKTRRHSCGGRLAVKGAASRGSDDILSGQLECESCQSRFPILAGVAIVVADVEGYLAHHVKGISSLVPDSEVPADCLKTYRVAKAELRRSGTEHIEDDLEAERVTALYVMNHYLSASSDTRWWAPLSGDASPLIERLVREHWDHGPLALIEKWVKEQRAPGRRAVELGCGVGGLAPRLSPYLDSYLGVDSSFASLALARHLALGAHYPRPVRLPEDLLQGPVSRKAAIPSAARANGADFIVGEIDQPPLEPGAWDLTLALNAIDMLEDPAQLPRLQHALLAPGGTAIQSCPYIWHESVAAKLRSKLPKDVRGSAAAVEWLYAKEGLPVRRRADHVPWLFFKHVRQLEIYSVHAFEARKP
jgi:SAM-dependent methyltransferase